MLNFCAKKLLLIGSLQNIKYIFICLVDKIMAWTKKCKNTKKLLTISEKKGKKRKEKREAPPCINWPQLNF